MLFSLAHWCALNVPFKMSDHMIPQTSELSDASFCTTTRISDTRSFIGVQTELVESYAFFFLRVYRLTMTFIRVIQQLKSHFYPSILNLTFQV